jgi:hypothetical protein
MLITNGFRTVRAIESVVRQRVNHASDSREQYPSSTEESIIALRAELCEILSLFEENRYQLADAQPPQEGLERDGILEDEVHVLSVAPAPAPFVVCFFFPLSSLFPPC